MAASSNNLAVAELLIRSGAEVDVQNKNVILALMGTSDIQYWFVLLHSLR